MAQKPSHDNETPRRPPKKLATMGPDSGPSGDLVVDIDAKPAGTTAPIIANEKDGRLVEAAAEGKKGAKAKKSNAKKYRVQATKPGWLGLRYIPADTVFDMLWSKEENGNWPSWVVELADDSTPTASTAHSAEAAEEFVDDDGIGHAASSKDLL